MGINIRLSDRRLQAYLIASVVVGATIGNYVFSSTMSVDSVLGSTAGSGLACH